MNCHSQIQTKNPKLQPVRDSWATGVPIQWVKIHNVPDYAYFNHSAHVNRGVSCVSCHGKVNEMNVVFQDQPQSMAWCLNCHRNPSEYVRPIAADKPGETSPVFNLNWHVPAGTTQAQLGRKLVKEWKINPPTDCAGVPPMNSFSPLFKSQSSRACRGISPRKISKSRITGRLHNFESQRKLILRQAQDDRMFFNVCPVGVWAREMFKMAFVK